MLLIIQITKDFSIYLRLDFLLKKGFRQLTAKSSHFPVLSISWPIDYFKWIRKKPCMILSIPLQSWMTVLQNTIFHFLNYFLPTVYYAKRRPAYCPWRRCLLENKSCRSSKWVFSFKFLSPSFLPFFLPSLFICFGFVFPRQNTENSVILIKWNFHLTHISRHKLAAEICGWWPMPICSIDEVKLSVHNQYFWTLTLQIT